MPHPQRTVVAGVASLDVPDPLLPHAAETARARGAVLHVVHAFEHPAPSGSAARERHAAELRLRLDARVRADAPGIETVCHVMEGAATECISAVAREAGAELVVVGATRRNRVWRRFLGTTAEGVVRRAGAPVLVLRSSPTRGLRRVLLATDLSDSGVEVHERGLDVSASLCPECSPAFRSLLVVRLPGAPGSPPRGDLEGAALRDLDAFVRGRRPRARGVQCRVRIGNTADEILAEASEWGADLVVLGTHGGGGASAFPLGSTTGATLRGAACNVLVIPPATCRETAPERTRGAEQASLASSPGGAISHDATRFPPHTTLDRAPTPAPTLHA